MLIKLIFPNGWLACKIRMLLLVLGLGYKRISFTCTITEAGVKQSQECVPSSVKVFRASVSHSAVGSKRIGLVVTPCLMLAFLISV